MKRMMNVKQAAQATGLSEWELKRGFAEGVYPHIRVGQGRGKFFVDIDLLEETLREMALKSIEVPQPTLPYGIRKIAK